jgi:hypothetical protein
MVVLLRTALLPHDGKYLNTGTKMNEKWYE